MRSLSLRIARRLYSSEMTADELVPPGTPRVAVEAGVTLGWERYVGEDGLIIGIDTFGASAPASVLAHEFGFTPERIAEQVRAHLG